MKPSYLFSVFLVLLQPKSGSTARILSIFLLCGRSSMNYFDPVHLALANNGHQITVITPTAGLVNHPNITEYPGLDFATLFRGMTGGYSDYFQMRMSGEKMSNPFHSLATKFSNDCDTLHNLPAVQDLIQGKLGKFDLLMTMAFMNECVYGIFDYLKAPTVLISTTPTMPWFAGSIGVPTPLGLVPHIYFPATDKMSFLERLENLLTYNYQMITRNWNYLPAIESVYRKYIPFAQSAAVVEMNVSLILGAGHQSFGPLRPEMPNLIDDIGGIHCRAGKTLPENIEQMIGNKPFIFFSLGSIVQVHQMPVPVKRAFLQAFEKFPDYNILWKWEADTTLLHGETLPENVKVAKWFPQQDLLADSNCKLFITHGGLSSLHETIYHAVPVIGIPFFGDQDWNMKQVEDKGVGMKLELREIETQKLVETFTEILTNLKYKERITKLSKIFRDRQVSALDKAVWNIEYILRHKGAPHLKLVARDLTLFQYYCIDVLLFLTFFIILITCITYLLCEKCFKKSPCDTSASKSSNKSKQH